MAAPAYFSPTDPLTINTALSLTTTGLWHIQEVNLSDGTSRAQGLKATGDEGARDLHDGKTSGTIVYDCFDTSGVLTMPKTGQIISDYHIDSIQLAYSQTGWPRMTLTVHKHADNNHTSCNTFDLGETTSGKYAQYPMQFGCPTTINDNASSPATFFLMNDATTAVKSLTFTFGCTHVDDVGSAGDHLAGENRDGIETMEVEFLGVPDTVTVHATWDEMADGSPASNTAAGTRRMSWERHTQRN